MPEQRKKSKLERMLKDAGKGGLTGSQIGLGVGALQGALPVMTDSLMSVDHMSDGMKMLRGATKNEKAKYLLKSAGKGAVGGGLTGAGIMALMSLLKED